MKDLMGIEFVVGDDVREPMPEPPQDEIDWVYVGLGIIWILAVLGIVFWN